MDAILNNLRDPSWWFTTIFVAIIASVVAGFLKEKIEKLVSSLSSRYKSWFSERAAARENIIRVLAENPQFLTLAYIRAVAELLFYVMAVVMYLVFPLFLDAASREFIVGDTDRLSVWSVLVPSLGIAAMYIGFRATSRLSLVVSALKLYRETNGFPRVP